jgi:hypothetical protein
VIVTFPQRKEVWDKEANRADLMQNFYWQIKDQGKSIQDQIGLQKKILFVSKSIFFDFQEMIDPFISPFFQMFLQSNRFPF